MTVLHVDGLKFDFPAAWSACKYDDWNFYRNQFLRIRPGIKAVVLIVLSPGTAWMIEVKDYRVHCRTKAVDIHEEFADKVMHTLSALLPAKVNANDKLEQDFAAKTLSASRVRLVLHLSSQQNIQNCFHGQLILRMCG